MLKRCAREARLQQAELEHYCVIDEERRRWEGRESHLFTQVAATQEELRIAKTVTTATN